ncbi:MAG TPA: DUF881 domain-containing protein [Pilimelia sp.]|nr:DUF881 domain-containing protein [Pilimelia sp.]
MTASAPEPQGRRPYGPDFLTALFRHPLDPGYADAAARRAERGPRTGWRAGAVRAGSALTILVIGFLCVVAYRQTVAEQPGRSRARAGLVAQVNERQDLTDGLQRRADTLRDEVVRQRDAALNDTMATRLRELETATGLAKVRGAGVVVRVDDAPSADDVAGSEESEEGRVFDRDLQHIANGLWGAGAEAIAINGQRLTATTTIRRAGRAILVDFRPVARPYQIAAIGPNDLQRRFLASKTAQVFRGLVDAYGMSFDVRGEDDLTLPAAAEPQLHYAQPVGPTQSGQPPPDRRTPSPAPTSRRSNSSPTGDGP